VETELGAVPGVHEYIVAGVRDPSGILEQVPWAFVVPKDGENFSTDEFVALARKRLAPHMVPRRIVVLPSLPLTPSGKPDRASAVRLYAETHAS
jgi:acyl-coenzyme A synthetase/AMP-(fatty) acid ligase